MTSCRRKLATLRRKLKEAGPCIFAGEEPNALEMEPKWSKEGTQLGVIVHKAAGQAFYAFLRNLHGPHMSTAVIHTEVMSGVPR